MIFVFAQIVFENAGKEVDNILDFFTGQSTGEQLGKVRSAGQLQKTGEGTAVQVKVQAKAHLVRVNLHRSITSGDHCAASSRQWIFLVLGPSNSQK